MNKLYILLMKDN